MQGNRGILHSFWNVTCRDKYGNIRWQELGIENLMHDEGEKWLLNVAFDETATVPASFYIGLDNRGTIAEADTLPPSGEPSGNGYARQPVNSDNTDMTIAQDSGDWQVTTKTVRFTASGGPIPVSGSVLNMFFSTTLDDTGFLIASVALSTARTILNGDSLDTSLIIKVSE